MDEQHAAVAPPLAACVIATMLIAFARPAAAQWYAAAYLGANHTMSAPVTIDQPAVGTSLQFADVSFVARPFTSPQYYGIRLGRMLGSRRHLGVEFEWMHPKVYADTSRLVHVTGRSAGAAVDTTARMDAFVQRYSMSHGMNFALANGVGRIPIAADSAGFASRVALTGRVGIAQMLPHAESTVAGVSRDHYQRAGIGFQVAGGMDVRVAGPLSATLEYKFGHARPEMTIADGTGRTTANVHQVAFGLAFGFTR